MMRRGPFNIVFSETIFLNDNEPGLIYIDIDQIQVTVQIEFGLPKSESNITRPQISISQTHDRFIMLFTGWNHSSYSAYQPDILGVLDGIEIRFAALNTYLDGTNKLDIQFYTRT